MQNVIKLSRLSRLGDACRQMAMGVAIWRWVSPNGDECRRGDDIAVIKISPRRGLRHAATAVAVWRQPSPRLCNRPIAGTSISPRPAGSYSALSHGCRPARTGENFCLWGCEATTRIPEPSLQKLILTRISFQRY